MNNIYNGRYVLPHIIYISYHIKTPVVNEIDEYELEKSISVC